MGDGPPGFGRGFTCPVLLGIPLGPGSVSGTGLSPCVAGLSRPFPCRAPIPRRGPATPGGKPPGLGSCAFARRYLRNHCLFSFPAGTEMFHFPASRPSGLCVHPEVTVSSTAGLLHSEILGSKRVCRSPGLIAAYRVLRRLAMPRHPPCALSRLCVSSKPFRSHSGPSPARRGPGFASKPRARFDCLESNF